jgi:hypothetical protein
VLINKNIQQPKVWPGSPSAHRSVLGASPLYPGGLQAASGGFRRQFTHLNILHPKTAQGAGQAVKRRICTSWQRERFREPLASTATMDEL